MKDVTDVPASDGLTTAETLILTGQRLHPGVPLYNMALAFRIAGPVDVERFDRAFGALVAGTDAMRTVVVEIDGVPRRRIIDDMTPDLEIADVSGEDDPTEAARAIVAEAARHDFDLGVRLYRSGLVRVGDTEFVWWLNQHHLATDGWSAAIVYRRMEQLYRTAGSGDLDPHPVYPSFSFYADFEHRFRTSDAYADEKSFWEQRTARDVEPLSFYGSTAVPGTTTHTDRVTATLGRERAQRLAELTDTGGGLMGGVSEFGVFSAALVATVGRATGRSDVTILVPAHNRSSARFKDTAGLFIEVLPLSVGLDPGETFETLLEKIAAAFRDVLVHGRPGTSAAATNRASSVLLNFMTSGFGDFNGWPVTSDWVHPGHGDADHVLRLQVHDFDRTGDRTLHFDLNRDVFDAEREASLMRHFETMLDALLEDASTPLAAVDLLDADEQEVLNAYNDTVAAVPHRSVVDAFRDQLSATPDARAVSTRDGLILDDAGDASLTYAGLHDAAQRLAADIVATHTDVVAIYLPRSVELVVAVWATLMAGAAYVPIDRAYPAERIGFILDDSGAGLVITDAEGASAGLAGHGERATLPVVTAPFVTEPPDDVGGVAPAARIDRDPDPDDLAYIMYTSGSTGTPKGVEVTHGGLINYVWWARGRYGAGGPISFPLYSSFGFDLTVTSLYVPTVTGGEVVVYPEPVEGADLSVRDVFTDDLVDAVKLTPSHLNVLDSSLLATRRIGTLIIGGEDLKTSVAHAAAAASDGRLTIYNEYGPTEATVGCMIHRYVPDDDTLVSVPIGHPIANTQIQILDDTLRPVPTGVVGELCVAGPGLARGYRNRPDLTADRFRTDAGQGGQRIYRTGDLARWRSPGRIEFLGRADTQVKIRGFRIELGEIESALTSHPSVAGGFVDVVESEAVRVAAGDVAYCVRCGLASNHPDSHIDADGVCRPCHFYEEHRHDAERYWRSRSELAARFGMVEPNAAGQDCLMLLSGGKDSTFALYQLVEMGRTPLVFSLDNGFISEGAKANIRRAVDDLGLELVMGTTPAMNEIFAESLTEFSNVCQGCFKTVYTIGTSLARTRGLRQIVTGLSRGQIFETRLADLYRMGVIDPDAVDAAIIDARRAYHRRDDAVRRSLDTDLFDDDAIFDTIEVIDYYRYHDVGLGELYSFLGQRAPWVRPADTGRSTNCLINDTGIFVHKLERGFHNYALPYSWDVRLGHKTREAALAELDDDIDVTQVRGILDEVGYTPHEPHGSGPAPGLRGTEKRLVAWYVSEGESPSPSEVRSQLAATVPDYMVPSYLVPIDAIPLTVNGKVDRRALPDPRRRSRPSDGTYVAPRSDVERRLVEVWQGVLQVDTIGVDDRFTELGGDSILNVQIVSTARRHGLVFTPQQLFRHPTVAELATVVERVGVETPLPMPAPAVGGFATPRGTATIGVEQSELDAVLAEFGEETS